MKPRVGFFQPEAKRDCPFQLTVTLCENPLDYNAHILRVGIIYPAPQASSLPPHTIFVFDKSSSMTSAMSDKTNMGQVATRMSVSKRNVVAEMSEDLNSGNHAFASMVTFAKSATTILEHASHFTAQIRADVESIKPEVGTNTILGLEQAMVIAKKYGGREDIKIIVSSDGEDGSQGKDLKGRPFVNAAKIQIEYLEHKYQYKMPPLFFRAISHQSNIKFAAEACDATGVKDVSYTPTADEKTVQDEFKRYRALIKAKRSETPIVIDITVGSLRFTDNLARIVHSNEPQGATHEVPTGLLGQRYTIICDGYTFSGTLPDAPQPMDDAIRVKYVKDEVQKFVQELQEQKDFPKVEDLLGKLHKLYTLLPEHSADTEMMNGMAALKNLIAAAPKKMPMSDIEEKNSTKSLDAMLYSSDSSSDGTRASMGLSGEVINRYNAGKSKIGGRVIVGHTIDFAKPLQQLVSVAPRPDLRTAITLNPGELPLSLEDMPSISAENHSLVPRLSYLLRKVKDKMKPSGIDLGISFMNEYPELEFTSRGKTLRVQTAPLSELVKLREQSCAVYALLTAYWGGIMLRDAAKVHQYRDRAYNGEAHAYVIVDVNPQEIYLLDATDTDPKPRNLANSKERAEAIQNYLQRDADGVLTRVLMDFKLPLPERDLTKITIPLSQRYIDVLEERRQHDTELQHDLEQAHLICPLTKKPIRHGACLVGHPTIYFEKSALEMVLKNFEQKTLELLFKNVLDLMPTHFLSAQIVDACKEVRDKTKIVLKKYELSWLPETAMAAGTAEVIVRESQMRYGIQCRLVEKYVRDFLVDALKKKTDKDISALPEELKEVDGDYFKDYLHSVKLLLEVLREFQSEDDAVEELTVLQLVDLNDCIYHAKQDFLSGKFLLAEKKFKEANDFYELHFKARPQKSLSLMMADCLVFRGHNQVQLGNDGIAIPKTANLLTQFYDELAKGVSARKESNWQEVIRIYQAILEQFDARHPPYCGVSRATISSHLRFQECPIAIYLNAAIGEAYLSQLKRQEARWEARGWWRSLTSEEDQHLKMAEKYYQMVFRGNPEDLLKRFPGLVVMADAYAKSLFLINEAEIFYNAIIKAIPEDDSHPERLKCRTLAFYRHAKCSTKMMDRLADLEKFLEITQAELDQHPERLSALSERWQLLMLDACDSLLYESDKYQKTVVPIIRRVSKHLEGIEQIKSYFGTLFSCFYRGACVEAGLEEEMAAKLNQLKAQCQSDEYKELCGRMCSEAITAYQHGKFESALLFFNLLVKQDVHVLVLAAKIYLAVMDWERGENAALRKIEAEVISDCSGLPHIAMAQNRLGFCLLSEMNPNIEKAKSLFLLAHNNAGVHDEFRSDVAFRSEVALALIGQADCDIREAKGDQKKLASFSATEGLLDKAKEELEQLRLSLPKTDTIRIMLFNKYIQLYRLMNQEDLVRSYKREIRQIKEGMAEKPLCGIPKLLFSKETLALLKSPLDAKSFLGQKSVSQELRSDKRRATVAAIPGRSLS